MKQTICILFAALVGVSAFGQLGANPTFNVTGSTVLTNGQTSTVYVNVPSTAKEQALQITFKAQGNCKSNLVATVSKSIDGSNWEGFNTWTIPANDTTVVSTVTNWTVNAYPKLKVDFTTTAIAGAGITNLVLHTNGK